MELELIDFCRIYSIFTFCGNLKNEKVVKITQLFYRFCKIQLGKSRIYGILEWRTLLENSVNDMALNLKKLRLSDVWGPS